MMRSKITGKIQSLLFSHRIPQTPFESTTFPPKIYRHCYHVLATRPNVKGFRSFYDTGRIESYRKWKPTSVFTSSIHLRRLNSSSTEVTSSRNSGEGDDDDEVEPIDDDAWEEEEEVEPEIGDGGDGGGVVFNNCKWGERALSIAQEVLLQFDDDELKLYAFKTSPRGYIYVRLDKLSNAYGCPSMDEVESFNRQFKAKLDETGASGDIPDDLAVEVSSPGAERLLKIPEDLTRFKDMPMRISYVENHDPQSPEKEGVFLLDLIDTESGCCVWKLTDVKENRDPAAKGRPMSRKRKDWRLRLPYDMFKKVTLYLDY